MKKINQKNVFKELLSLSIKLEKLPRAYKNSVDEVTKDTLIKFRGFPEKVLKSQVDKSLNRFARELFYKRTLGLTIVELEKFCDDNSVHPFVKKMILNAEYEDEKDDDYDKLKMFEEDELLGIVRNYDYKKNFKEYKKLVEKREKYAEKHGISQKNTKKMSNPKPKP